MCNVLYFSSRFMHFRINNVTGIWIGNYNHLVSSISNILQFPYFRVYTKILTESGKSPFHHTFPEGSRHIQQTISWVDCHFFQAVNLPSVLHAGGTGGGALNLPSPTSYTLRSQLALSILPLATLALFRLRNIKHRCVIFLFFSGFSF